MRQENLSKSYFTSFSSILLCSSLTKGSRENARSDPRSDDPEDIGYTRDWGRPEPESQW